MRCRLDSSNGKLEPEYHHKVLSYLCSNFCLFDIQMILQGFLLGTFLRCF